MKILYIGVHSHEVWGAEYWLTQAFSDLQIGIEACNELRNKGTSVKHLKF